MEKQEYKVSAMGLALMYPCFAMFGLIDLAVAPIRFVNDRVKNENGESITDILRDTFKNPIDVEV